MIDKAQLAMQTVLKFDTGHSRGGAWFEPGQRKSEGLTNLYRASIDQGSTKGRAKHDQRQLK